MKFNIITTSKQVLSDTITPVGIYLKFRDIYPNTILLESSDYHGSKGSWSFICANPIANFIVEKGKITEHFPDGTSSVTHANIEMPVAKRLDLFRQDFMCTGDYVPVNGIFGYLSFDSIEYFEQIKFNSEIEDSRQIPEVFYSFYKYIIAVNHFHNSLLIIENLLPHEKSEIGKIESLLQSRNFAVYPFKTNKDETSNHSDIEYMQMVTKGKESCKRGDVFQIVLSRRYKQTYTGDDFNVYRALRSINPSPYLFYFDYGSFRLFGSSPEAELEIKSGKAFYSSNCRHF